MENREECTSMKEQEIKYLDKLEEIMGLELMTGYARADEWAARLEGELERPGYSMEATQRISLLLYHVMEDDHTEAGDIYAEMEERESLTPEEITDICTVRLPGLRKELVELEQKLPPTSDDVFAYLSVLNTVLKSENERLRNVNNRWIEENEMLKDALLAVCRYYGQPSRRTHRLAEDVMYHLTELEEIYIPPTFDAK